MGKTNLGRVSVAPRGAYNSETSYKRLDVVEYEGSSYLFLKDSTGVPPTGDGIVTMFLAKKGKDFTYADFTPEQLTLLKGADGKDGADGLKGDKGEPGKGLTILGYYGTLDLLKAGVTTPEPGDAYGVGTAAPYDIYVFDGVTSDWVDNGKLSGGGGEGGGNVVLIPAAIMGLTPESTSEEILTAWGGKENFISTCKKLNDSKAICKLYGGDENQSVSYVITVSSINYADDNNVSIELYVGAGASSLMLQASLANGVASFNVKSQNPVTSTKLPGAIFDLTSQSTSEQILNVFGGIDKIADIYNKIGYSSENQYDILITDNYYNGNGYSVLHNFGGSNLAPSHNKGFDRQIYFAYTSINPTIEVTRWVIKFNNTSAACEVTKKEVGVANIVSIPNGVLNLTNESTSEQIVTTFGGIQAFSDIITKTAKGNAISVIGATEQSTFGSFPCFFAVNNYVDLANLDAQFMITMAGDTLMLYFTVNNSVFSLEKTTFSALKSSDLVSDPSVGGTDKPASAEAVKVVNDKIIHNVISSSQDVLNLSPDYDSVILLWDIPLYPADQGFRRTIIGDFIGTDPDTSSSFLDIKYSVFMASVLSFVGRGYSAFPNLAKLCTCQYNNKQYVAIQYTSNGYFPVNEFVGYVSPPASFETIRYFDRASEVVINQEVNSSISALSPYFKVFP